MKNLLVIYPHWPPSNLAGVHRPRLVANYLPEFGWHPIVLTVHPDFYEEPHDWDLCKTVSPKIEVVQVKALKITRFRIVGDIGLRAFLFLYLKAREIIQSRKIDFIWIPIPSFYTALLGRMLYEKCKIPYGIDYIDPWVRDISGRKDWRHILSNALARLLEPIAIKKASLISGVAEEYYTPAILRSNSRLGGESGEFSPLHVNFPYGFDPHDHEIQLKDEDIALPWQKITSCKPLVYAGAFLPNSRLFIKTLFKCIRQLIDEGNWDQQTHLYFLGTGLYPGKSIVDFAKDYGIESIVHEIRSRYPFLHILNFLYRSQGVMVIGSTERHYTASKVFQAVLSRKPVFAILHDESSAYNVLQEVHAGSYVVPWSLQMEESNFINEVACALARFIGNRISWQPNYSLLYDKYSSKSGTRKLSEAINSTM